MNPVILAFVFPSVVLSRPINKPVGGSGNGRDFFRLIFAFTSERLAAPSSREAEPPEGRPGDNPYSSHCKTSAFPRAGRQDSMDSQNVPNRLQAQGCWREEPGQGGSVRLRVYA